MFKKLLLLLALAAITLPTLNNAHASGKARLKEPTTEPSSQPSSQGEKDMEDGFNRAARGDLNGADQKGGDGLQHEYLDKNGDDAGN